MKVKLITLLVLLFCSTIIFSQNDEKKPLPLLPGNGIENHTTDTMWVLHSTQQFKKVINAKLEAEAYKKINELNQKIIDSLELISKEQKELIARLNVEYDSCYITAENCNERLELLGQLNTKQTMYTRIAIIAGVTTTISAFVVGFILGLK